MTEFRFPYVRAVQGGGREPKEIVVEADTFEEALEKALDIMNEE
jgi:hypothetical protein